MSIEAFNEAHETDYAFRLAAAAVRQRFLEAAELDIEDSTYSHLLLDNHPSTPDTLATFLLVEDYELFLRGKGHWFEVSVPVAEPSLRNPVTILGISNSADYFVLAYQHRDTERTFRVDSRTGGEGPVVGLPRKLSFDSLTEKILSYTLVPLRILS